MNFIYLHPERKFPKVIDNWIKFETKITFETKVTFETNVTFVPRL